MPTRRHNLIDLLEPRRLLAAGYQIELAFDASVPANVQTLVQQAASRWQQVITGDLPDEPAGAWGAAVDDLRIAVSVTSIDGAGGGIAQTRPTYVHPDSHLPFVAEMQLDSSDIGTLQANGTLASTITHEMAHALGFGTTWKVYPGITSGLGGSNPLFLGANAVREYQALGGTGSGVPLETTGGTGTRDTHWSEATFNNELMTGFINSGSNLLSRITIGSLADLGYTVNYFAADAYSIPGVSPPVTPPPSPATLSGRVFNDANQNGVLDNGESGAGGRTVYVDANFDGALDNAETSATTASDGSFTLNNITAGSYAIRTVVPSGQTQTTPAGGNAIFVTLSAGQNASGYLFGTGAPVVVTPPPTNDASIGGKVFDDLNGNGKQDKNEPNASGRTIYLDTNNDGTKDSGEPSTTTASNGTYSFAGLAAGTFNVREVLPSGYSQTTPKSNAARVVAVTSSQSVTNAHFGTRPPLTASLGGKLFNDKNANGKQDKGETNLKGFVLWLDLDDDAKFDKGVEPTATTDKNGQYRFTKLAPGNYTVRVALSGGYKQATPKKSKPQRTTLDVAESVLNLHFGLRK